MALTTTAAPLLMGTAPLQLQEPASPLLRKATGLPASGRRMLRCSCKSESAANEGGAEKVEWKAKREALLQKGVKSVSAKDALRLQQNEKHVLLDVRPKNEFAEGHPSGALNAEVYRLIKEWTAWDILRRAGFAFFGVFNGTELNPDFVKDVADLGLSKGSPLILACGNGGTMKPSQNFTDGKESRSLIAAYILTQEGYTKVYHLEGGLGTWFREDLPVSFPEDEEKS
eukprot:TRINITY_DN590_c0_g1_i1.p1 TRINITY_DN590_c0_g1~~TRINITY_DN590_c0_g1_i1.p1  ORF type:complete len:228 (-),score=51.93 TRINITY_DN590_c0_g1_i1:406-1089(-)